MASGARTVWDTICARHVVRFLPQDQLQLRGRPLALWLDVAVKLALLVLLLYAVVRRDLAQFEGKGVVARALLYPIAALLVPAVWFARGRRDRYPFDVDALLVLPFLIHTAGNAANVYDTISWWDDANHFVNWTIFVAGFGRLLVRLPLGRLNVFGLALGFGAVTAIL